jgi:hypothetical protein
VDCYDTDADVFFSPIIAARLSRAAFKASSALSLTITLNGELGDIIPLLLLLLLSLLLNLSSSSSLIILVADTGVLPAVLNVFVLILKAAPLSDALECVAMGVESTPFGEVVVDVGVVVVEVGGGGGGGGSMGEGGSSTFFNSIEREGLVVPNAGGILLLLFPDVVDDDDDADDDDGGEVTVFLTGEGNLSKVM